MTKVFVAPPLHPEEDYAYAIVDQRDLIYGLTTAIVEIAFVLPDGGQGFTRGTLQPGYFKRVLTEQEKQERTEIAAGGKKGIDVVHVWSVTDNDWVSIRFDRILSAQLAGS